MKDSVSFRYVFWMSRLLLVMERACVSFWPILSLILLTMALAGFGVLAMLPAWLHLLTLTTIVAAGIYLTLRPFVRFSFPRRRDVLRALEKQNHFTHAPLQLLEDDLPRQSDGRAILFWEHAREDASRNIRGRVNIYRPWPAIAGQDPHGLRHAAALLFILFVMTAQSAAPAKITAGIWPDFSGNDKNAKPPSMEAWITAPDYTGKPPVVIASARQDQLPDTLAVPENSILHIRSSGYRFTPVIKANGNRVELTEEKDGSLSADIGLTTSASLSIRYFLSFIASTDVQVIADTPPELKLFGTEKAHMGGVRLSYMAKDDYAITRLYGTLAAPDRRGYMTEYHFDMPTPAQSAEQTNSIQDFSNLPVAGRMAVMTLTAEDAAGHIVSTTPVQVAIPEREFKTPVAAAIAFERKRLLAYNDAITRKLAIYGLMQAARFPAHYKNDPIVYMGLVTSIKRLGFDRENMSVDTVAPLLWDLAIRIEDGGLMTATMDATKAMEQLQKVLADKNATAGEIAQAVEAAKRAMDSYMQALAREMLQRVQQGQKPMILSPELAAKLSQRIDMGAMSKAMDMMRMMNDRAAMQKLARQMQDALQNIDINKMNEMNKQVQKSLQALDAIYPLINDQRTLRDITRLLEPGKTEARLPLAQDKLKARLDEIINGIRATMDVPESFDTAGEKMMLSSKKLSSADSLAAASFQDEALDALQKAFDASANQMASMMQQKMSFMPGFSGARPGRTDPFGRGMGTSTESDVTLPDQEEQGRVQKIIRDLRNRANDSNKSKVERDYIDRLLDIMN